MRSWTSGSNSYAVRASVDGQCAGSVVSALHEGCEHCLRAGRSVVVDADGTQVPGGAVEEHREVRGVEDLTGLGGVDGRSRAGQAAEDAARWALFRCQTYAGDGFFRSEPTARANRSTKIDASEPSPNTRSLSSPARSFSVSLTVTTLGPSRVLRGTDPRRWREILSIFVRLCVRGLAGRRNRARKLGAVHQRWRGGFAR